MSERPTMDDDLDRAYARAHTLAGDGGPAAAVRANVLAAAQALADEAAARRAVTAATPPLAAAEPPMAQVAQMAQMAQMAQVGGGRPRAANLASWRVRVGAAFCAIALVGLGSWRHEALRRDDGAVQVAAADRAAEAKLAEAPPPPPKDLPATTPAAAPPAEASPAADAAPSARDRALVVAEAGQPSRTLARSVRRELPPAGTVAHGAVPTAAAPPVRELAAAPAPETIVVAQAAAPPALAAKSSMAAAPAPKPLVAPAPTAPTAAVPSANATAADAAGSAEPAPVVLAEARSRSAALSEAKRAAPATAGALAGAGPRVPALPLQAAADRGDLEALRTLLANPATRVDAPDADGRTALLHAVLAQQPGAVRLLLAAGADPGRADQAGLTPRQAARTGASAEVAALLAAPR